MSGHSKWSTIKHQKGVADQARGKLFSKLAKAIMVAAKEGGGVDPESNYKLRAAIDEAKAANMPKDNIKRALDKVAGGESDSLEEVIYEGFGPSGVGLLIQVTTDNRNRTGQEIKNLLENSGGSLGSPGSVSFNFKSLGKIMLPAGSKADELMLGLIDQGAEDVVEKEGKVIAYVEPARLHEIRNALEKEGIAVQSAELVQKPITSMQISDQATADKVVKLLHALEDHDDVQKVFSTAELS